MSKDAVKIDSVIPDGFFVNMLIDKNIFQGALDMLPFVIVGLDRHFDIVFFNDVAEDLLGFKKDQIIGKNWIDKFITHENKNEVNLLLSDSVNKLKVRHLVELPVNTKSGKKKYLVWQLMIVIKDNKYRTLLMAGLDITERKRLEERLNKSCAKLKIKNRDLNLTLKQLRRREQRQIELTKKLEKLKKTERVE